MRYRYKYQVLSTGQNILEVYKYYNITHISLRVACTACTDMVYSKELERDVTTSAMAKAILRLKIFGIYNFIEHDRIDFFTSEERIRAVMYMQRVNCSCSELKLAKHLHTFFVLT